MAEEVADIALKSVVSVVATKVKGFMSLLDFISTERFHF
jgi:hypothetical protein